MLFRATVVPFHSPLYTIPKFPLPIFTQFSPTFHPLQRCRTSPIGMIMVTLSNNKMSIEKLCSSSSASIFGLACHMMHVTTETMTTPMTMMTDPMTMPAIAPPESRLSGGIGYVTAIVELFWELADCRSNWMTRNDDPSLTDWGEGGPIFRSAMMLPLCTRKTCHNCHLCDTLLINKTDIWVKMQKFISLCMCF